MMYRPINDAQARGVLRILKEECGYNADTYAGLEFIRSILAPNPESEQVCHEYRFMGAIGSGGKFCNNGNYDNTPYVDCYPESQTPKIGAMIMVANHRLAELFRDVANEIEKAKT